MKKKLSSVGEEFFSSDLCKYTIGFFHLSFYTLKSPFSHHIILDQLPEERFCWRLWLFLLEFYFLYRIEYQ